MSGKATNTAESRKGTAHQKGKDKVLNMIDWFLDSVVYDLVTWVAIAFSIGLTLVYLFAVNPRNWRGAFWSLMLLAIFASVMIAVRVDQRFFRGKSPKDVVVKPNSNRPYITVTAVTLQNLVLGQKPRVVIEFTAGGQVAAHKIQVSSQVALAQEADWQPDYTRLRVLKIDPILVPPNKLFSNVFASWEVTKTRLDGIRDGKRFIYVLGNIEFSDESGSTFPPYRYCFRYDPRSESFALYTPPDIPPITDFIVPNEPVAIDIDRPKVVVTKIALGDVGIDLHPRYEVKFMNVSEKAATGKANAYAVIALMTVSMSETPQFPKDLNTADVEFDSKEERTARLTANFALTASDIESMKKKTLWLYVYGFVDYVDKAAKPYKTKFCAWYNPDTQRVQLCDYHNRTD